MPDTTDVERAILLSLAAAASIAMVGTLLVYLARAWANARTQFQLVTNLLALLCFLGVYVLSVSALTWLVNRQVNGVRRTDEVYVTYYYVHVGTFGKLVPLFVMLAVWSACVFIRRRSSKSQVAA